MNEFALIDRYFKPLTQGREEALSLSDDAAMLAVPDGFELVVSTDTLCEGVHFRSEDDPAYIAQKALRVNLSDIAAMGAKPYAYQLALSLPGAPQEPWVKAFCEALAQDQARYDVFCSGGDTTRSSAGLVISITMLGLVPSGQAVKRSGAKDGDVLCVTGAVGAAQAADYHHLPEPRCALAALMQSYAHAAIDISDGFLADLEHICAASGMGCDVRLADIPVCQTAQGLPIEEVLSGGEDYELLLAIPSNDWEAFTQQIEALGVSVTAIGEFTAQQGVRIIDAQGEQLEFTQKGWQHF